jgi:hypothetical protein
MIKNLSDIEKMLNLEAGTLQKGIESKEEINIELPNLVIRTEEEENDFKKNLDLDLKRKYDEGKEKGVKDEINAHLDKFGLSLDQEKKTFENFAKALSAKLEADVKTPVDKKLEELKADKEKLQNNLQDVSSQFETFKAETTNRERNLKLDNEISSHIPTEGLNIPREDLQILFKNKYQFDFSEDGNINVLDQNGNVLKDEKTRNPVPVKNVIESFSENYMVKQPGTGGGDDGGKGGAKSDYDSFRKEMLEKGLNEGGEEYQREFNKRVNEGTIEL